MNQPPDNFDALRKLLALKRHESPPPAYFDRLAGLVIARLEAEEGMRSPNWWQRWWEALNSPPVVALSYGAAVVGLVMLGTGLLQSLELEADPALAASQPWFVRDSLPAVFAAKPFADAPMFSAIEMNNSESSFNPVLGNSAPTFLFNPSGMSVERVSYQPR